MSKIKDIIKRITDAGFSCKADKSLSDNLVGVIGWDNFEGGPHLTFFKYNRLESLQKFEGKKVVAF